MPELFRLKGEKISGISSSCDRSRIKILMIIRMFSGMTASFEFKGLKAIALKVIQGILIESFLVQEILLVRMFLEKNTMKILLIEDEPAISGFIKKGLEENACEVTQAYDGDMGLTIAKRSSFDVMIIDLIIPGINGLILTEKIRKELKIKTPIIMLSALSETDDIVKGLNAGADDYLAKPFKFQELLARVHALARRGRDDDLGSNLLQVNDLVVDLNKKNTKRAGQEIHLTQKEFYLLCYLLRNRNRVLSRMDILENVWDVQFDMGTNVVDVYINYLRKKVDKPFDVKLIKTVTGMGYMIESSS